MKYFLIHGTQVDGEHEYQCFDVLNTHDDVSQPSGEECLLKLRQRNLFGYENEDEPGDDLTGIQFEHVEEITPEDYVTLRRLKVIYE